MGPETKARSIGPDKKPLSIGPDPGTPLKEYLGTGWRGIELNRVELSNVAALSRPELYGHQASPAREVERGVELLALTEAPEIARNVVVLAALLLSFPSLLALLSSSFRSPSSSSSSSSLSSSGLM